MITRILMAAAIGTTSMTLFSYMLSQVFERQFREPVILNKLFFRLPRLSKGKKNRAFGWTTHYLTGLIVDVIYWLILYGRSYSLANFMALGAATGIIGCLVWEAVLRLHPRPPRLHLSKFYIQLFFAHLFFGFGSWVAYRDLA